MLTNTKIICSAVDDEPPALQIIEKYISEIPTLELAETCVNAVDALGILQKQKINLLFLDIQMPHILGTDFMRTLSNPPKVIFTTAYRKYAVEGFDLDAVDFLLKPISFERFLKGVNKILQLNLPDNNDIASESHPEAVSPFLYFRVNRKMVK